MGIEVCDDRGVKGADAPYLYCRRGVGHIRGHVGVMALAIAVGVVVVAVGVTGLWPFLRARPAFRAVSFHLKPRFYPPATRGTPGLVL